MPMPCKEASESSTNYGREPMDQNRPRISVIMPVLNEARYIRRTVRDLLGQEYDTDRYEVFIVDGGSTDATREIVLELAAGHPNVQILDNPRRLSSAARNVGIRHSTGDLIVIVDGHCNLGSRTYLRDLADAFAQSGADCLGRPQPLDIAGASPLQQAIAAARSSRLGHHPASYIYASEGQFVPPQSVAVAYRRSVFETVGFFDESFDACEDVEFNHRVALAGLRCYLDPRLRVSYHPRTSLAGLFRQMVRYGRGRARLLRKHPETFSAPGLVPAAFVLGLVCGLVLSLVSPVAAAFYTGTLTFYTLIVGTASVVIALRSDRFSLLTWLPLVFATIHVGAGTGILQELLAGGTRRCPECVLAEVLEVP